jgi:hypothetical protein
MKSIQAVQMYHAEHGLAPLHDRYSIPIPCAVKIENNSDRSFKNLEEVQRSA